LKRSVNFILFTPYAVVHLILRASPHHSPHLRSHHLSLPRPFTPESRLFSLFGSIWTAFLDVGIGPRLGAWALAFVLAYFLFLVTLDVLD